MASEKTDFLRETESLRDLRALEAIERDPGLSQRQLANTLGVAVGVANACIRTLVRKGLIKIRGESNRSITYHLTKAGVLQKTLLAMEWTRNTVDFYRQARREIAAHLISLAASGVCTVVFDGANEIAEIGVLVAPESGVRPLAVLRDEDTIDADIIVGVPVVTLEQYGADEPDAVVLCVDPTAERVERLRRRFGAAVVSTPFGPIPDEKEEE